MISSIDVAVIGGGITGLVAAHRLRSLGRSVALFEATDSVGGVIRSERADGLLLEHGPFSVMVRSPEFHGLIDELGLTPDRAEAGAGRNRYVQRGGRLHLVPSSPRRLVTTSLLSPLGKARLIRGLFASAPRPEAAPPTLHEMAYRRLGREAAERLAGPGCIGIFAAESDELGVEACMPTLAQADRTARSVLGLKKAAQRTDGFVPDRSMVSFDGGLTTLADALAADLGADIRLSTPVQSLCRLPGGGGFNIGVPGQTLASRAVIVACGVPATARIIAELSPRSSKVLREMRHASLGVVHLAFARDRVTHALDGFGYLVPKDEPRTEPVLGVIWPGSVFPSHCPRGTVLLRVMVGGARWPEALRRSDEELVQQSLSAVRPVLGVQGEPIMSRVVRWPDSVPIYDTTHAQRVQAIQGASDVPPDVLLAGSWVCGPIGGLGVNDRIRHAHQAATSAARLVDTHPVAAETSERAAG